MVFFLFSKLTICCFLLSAKTYYKPNFWFSAYSTAQILLRLVYYDTFSTTYITPLSYYKTYFNQANRMEYWLRGSKIAIWDGISNSGKIGIYLINGFKFAKITDVFGIHDIEWSPSAQILAVGTVGSRVWTFWTLCLSHFLKLFL